MDFHEIVNEVFSAAYIEVKHRKHEYLTLEHILYASLHFEESARIIGSCNGDIDEIKNDIEEHFKRYFDSLQNEVEPIQSIAIQNMLTRVQEHAMNCNKPVIRIGDVLVAIYDEEDNFASYFLRKQNIRRVDLLRSICNSDFFDDDSEYSDDDLEYDDDDEYDYKEDDIRELDDLDSEEEIFDEDEIARLESLEKDRLQKKKAGLIKKFAIDLTEKAREGRIDPLIGREDIINRTVQILCRRTKNNPIHIGDPGVGKTAITEGLAKLIVDEKVPMMLRQSEIYYLDMGTMIAGTKYRGDFEERIKKVLDEISKKENPIVYIDEIHTIVGAGAVGGAMDASNILKPYLSDGRIRFIGSTTYEEYKKFFEKDRALSRRFQKIDVPEPSVKDTIDILLGLKESYESYHKVVYTEEALVKCVELSHKYINDRQLPDKAIDIIDEAGAYCRLNTEEQEEIITVDGEIIEKVICGYAKIPMEKLESGELLNLKNLEEKLKGKIFGQDKAIDSVVTAIKRSRAGFNDDNKPVASLLFVGPTGVGKTELSKQLSQHLDIPLVRFDMSEYQEKHTVARMIGSPPGYVGYEEGGLLTEAIRKTPNCVLLLDEIEKVHPDILNVLLQVMDYATLTDNTGKKADFKNVILIMTSNAGARDIGKSMLGFGERVVDKSAIKEEVERVFAPEFRNRIDEIVVFNKMNEEMARNISEKVMKSFAEKLAAKNIKLEVTEKAYKYLANKGFSTLYGAREINRVVQKEIKPYFVDAVLFGELAQGGTAVVDLDEEGKILIK